MNEKVKKVIEDWSQAHGECEWVGARGHKDDIPAFNLLWNFYPKRFRMENGMYYKGFWIIRRGSVVSIRYRQEHTTGVSAQNYEILLSEMCAMI